MSNPEVVQRPPVERWQVESIRLTAFPAEPVDPLAKRWWKDLVGEEPTARAEKPREQEVREEGDYASGRLSVTAQPLRIDWRLEVQEQGGEPPEPLATLGPLPSVLKPFSELMGRWLQTAECPRLKRLAFGAVLLQPVDDRVTGYRVLSRYLHAVKIDPEGSSDLIYVINRPRGRGAAQVVPYLNRLSNWGVILTRIARWDIVGGDPSPSAQEPRSACRVELDMNTPAEFRGQLPRELAPQILHELLELALEITEKGDIP